jgi:hypothetical protein
VDDFRGSIAPPRARALVTSHPRLLRIVLLSSFTQALPRTAAFGVTYRTVCDKD